MFEYFKCSFPKSVSTYYNFRKIKYWEGKKTKKLKKSLILLFDLFKPQSSAVLFWEKRPVSYAIDISRCQSHDWTSWSVFLLEQDSYSVSSHRRTINYVGVSRPASSIGKWKIHSSRTWRLPLAHRTKNRLAIELIASTTAVQGAHQPDHLQLQ